MMLESVFRGDVRLKGRMRVDVLIHTVSKILKFCFACVCRWVTIMGRIRRGRRMAR